ncbi:MAG: hypothetical protein AAF629_33100 [Chloroflexota bacterium]
MSYFQAKLGPASKKQNNDQVSSNSDCQPNSPSKTAPKFTTQLKPNSGLPAQDTLADLAQPEHCPLCRSALKGEAGIYHCQGRCKGQWWLDLGNHLVDVLALPFGLCQCCSDQRQALQMGEQGPVCPVTGEQYLILPNGTAPRQEAAPDGLCHCCVPAMPLQKVDDYWVCQSRPTHHYQHQSGEMILITAPTASFSPEERLQAIDDALRRNTARLTTNGLFD